MQSLNLHRESIMATKASIRKSGAYSRRKVRRLGTRWVACSPADEMARDCMAFLHLQRLPCSSRDVESLKIWGGLKQIISSHISIG